MKFAYYFLILPMLSCGCSLRKPLTISQLENNVFQESNRVRLSRRQKALVLDKSLSRLARRYSRDMGTRRFFSHKDPDGRDVRERLWAAGFSFQATGENLARVKGLFNAQQLLDAWVKSIHHRDVLLGDYRKIGIGIYRKALGEYYITQIFTKPFLHGTMKQSTWIEAKEN